MANLNIEQSKLNARLFTNNSTTYNTKYNNLLASNDTIIRSMSKNGHTTKEIAQRIDIPYQRVWQYMNKHDIPTFSKMRYYRRHIDRIKELLKQYHNLSTVARKLGIAYPTLYKVYKESEAKPQHYPGTKLDYHHDTITTILFKLKANYNKLHQAREDSKHWHNKYCQVQAAYRNLIFQLSKYLG